MKKVVTPYIEDISNSIQIIKNYLADLKNALANL